ncbi:MAG: 5-oxoprolinase subunit PxpA [Leifsonia sp.]
MDLNCDLGEGVGDDAAIFPLVSSANIACGYHAGDVVSMLESCRLAVAGGVAIGAHPSYRDREGFGRRPMEVEAGQLTADTLVQLRVLDVLARQAGGHVAYLKPHGALYNRVAVDPVQAEAVVAAVVAFDRALVVLSPAGSALERAALTSGLEVRREAFVDRGYLADGSLASRGTAGAVIEDPGQVAARAVALATTGRIRAIDGTELELTADSLCLHGDTPGAPALAATVRAALEDAGIRIAAFA